MPRSCKKERRLVTPDVTLFPAISAFEWFAPPARLGTSVPTLAYFHSGCAISVAQMLKQKVETGERIMLGWVVTFLIVALIAGILGFGGVAGASIEIAKIIFFVAILLFLVSAVVGLARGRTRV
jgi:uncharacterized membrane protein YtjA (UPF0391 family)